MSKKEGRRVHVDRFEPHLTPEELKAMESMKKKGETYKAFFTRFVKEKLRESSSKPSALPQAIQKAEVEAETPQIPPCPFCAKISDTEIECGKQLKKGKKPIRMSLASCIACWKRREYIRRKLETRKEEPTKEAEEEREIGLSKLPKIREPTIHEIVNQVGVCENPILARRRHGGLACVLCKKQVPQKWQACQEIQKELKTSQIAFDKFSKAMRQRTLEEKEAGEDPYWWWGAPKTEDMTLEEIEEELGLREASKPRRISCIKFCTTAKIMNCEKYPSCELNTGLTEPEELDVFDIAEREAEPLRFARGKTIEQEELIPQELFDAMQKRYHEICETCEEHTKHRCTNYCKEFWEGLPSDIRTEIMKFKRYPSEEALKGTLRERLKEIVSEAKE